MNSYMIRVSTAIVFVSTMALSSLMLATPAAAQKTYGPGVTDTEIKIGNVTPYTGLSKDYGVIGLAEAAYFQMINDRGGVNGRKINFISVDSDSDPRKSLEQTRKLVEQDHVFLMFSSFGTESNLDVRAYLNEKKIPQLFVDSSSAVFDDPLHFPWTMGLFATYRLEGRVYAKYILENKPRAKIAVLYANDDVGKEYLAGVHDGLREKASTMIVKEVSYEDSDSTIDPKIVALKDSGADVFLNLSVGVFTTAAIRKAYDIDWHPLQFIPNASLSIAAFLDPAGLKKSAGIITNARSKGWLTAGSRSDYSVRQFVDWMGKYNPQASLRDQNNVAGYERAQVLIEVLKNCGDNLTRENAMREASHLDLELGILRPGIMIKTTPDDYQPIKQLFLMQFNGSDWDLLGPVTDH